MIDFVKGIFGPRNKKLEKMLSNDVNLNIRDFKKHYRSYKPVIEEIGNFDKKDLLDTNEIAEFTKKDLYNLVINDKEPCSPEERDEFINQWFGRAPYRTMPLSKHEIVDTVRVLDYLGATPHESLAALRYYFDSPIHDCIIDDIASKHLNFRRVESHSKMFMVRTAIFNLIRNLDYNFLLHLKENIMKHDDFMLICFEPYIALSVGGVIFLGIFQSLHVRGTFKKIMIDIISVRQSHFSMDTKVKVHIVKKVRNWLNKILGRRKFGLITDHLCHHIFSWFSQSVCALFAVSILYFIL